MNTPSHLLVTAALGKPMAALTRRHPDRWPLLSRWALLLGSILPDLPLIAISVWAMGSDWVNGVFQNEAFAAAAPGTPPTPELLALSKTMTLFRVWFYENPWVITAQNLFHSPLLIVLYLVIGYVMWRRGREWGQWFFWLAIGCLLHTLADIPLHVDDGPLLLFPLNWHLRFQSPISYWDPRYHGREWSVFENLLDVTLLIYLFIAYRQRFATWIRQKRRTKAVAASKLADS